MLNLAHFVSFDISLNAVCAKDNRHLPTEKSHRNSATSISIINFSPSQKWLWNTNLKSQCAAVSTKLGAIRNPPHLCVPLICTDAMYFRVPSLAFFPLMISCPDEASCGLRWCIGEHARVNSATQYNIHTAVYSLSPWYILLFFCLKRLTCKGTCQNSEKEL